MVSGSQLQVAKLAQMFPAAPSSSQRCPAAHSGGQLCPAAPSGTPGQNPGRPVAPNGTEQHQPVLF